MKKQDIVNDVKSYAKVNAFDIKRLVVGYGSAAVMHGIRETTGDVDLEVDTSLYTFVDNTIGSKRGKGLSGDYISLGNLDFHDVVQTDVVEIDGIMVVGKATLLKQYEWLYSHPERNPAKLDNDKLVIDALS